MALDRTAYYADASTPASIATITAAMADAEADQIAVRQIQSYKWADAAARTAATGMTEGDIGYQLDTNVNYLYDGAAWGASQGQVTAWVTYSPTLTNFTVGAGGSPISTVRWRYVGTMIEVDYKFVLGTTGAITGAPRFTLPVTGASTYVSPAIRGVGSLIDISAGTIYMSFEAVTTSAGAATIYYNGSPAPPPLANISSTAPFTWAVGDILEGAFTFEPA